MGVYEYQDLDLGRPTVRFLRLLSEGHMDDIQGELFEGWIGQPHGGISYDALSYTWGSKEKTATITINGGTMNITSNLYEALQHLRLNNQDRILWVDAICINQDSDKERGHQVRQMSRIYKEAEQVIVWLGRGTEESDYTMDFIKRLNESDINVNRTWTQLTRTSVSLEPRGPIIPVNRLQEGMELMLEQRWFKRIWILQEIANARAATIVCGRKSVSARLFAEFPSVIGLRPETHCQAVLDIMPGSSRKQSWWAEKRDLYTLLVKFRDSEATDERDIIYALLGLSSDACRSDILIPSYTKSIKQVVRDTTSFMLSPANRDGSLYAFLDWTLPEFMDNLRSLSRSVLHIAAENGHDLMVNHLLPMNKVGEDAANRNPWIPLCRASYNRRETVIRLSPQNGASIYTENREEKKLLLLAAMNGHKAVVQLLLDKGADVRLQDYTEQTPLSLAAANGHTAVVRVLLKYDSAPSFKEYGTMPILLAAENGHSAVVGLLVEKGAGLEARNSNHETPLLISASKGNEEVVRLLLEKGANVNYRNIQGQTALSLAVKNRHYAVLKLLAKGAEYETKLFLAAERGGTTAVQVLLEASGNHNLRNSSGQTVLSWGARWGQKEVVQLLIKKAAKIDSKSSNGRTPLSWAAEFGHVGIIFLLLENGAKPNSKDTYGRTALAWASRQGHVAVVKLLLEKGAHLESKDTRYGRTPLSLAAGGGHMGVVVLLVARGAKLESRDSKYHLSPISWAARSKHDDIVQLLLQQVPTSPVE